MVDLVHEFEAADEKHQDSDVDLAEDWIQRAVDGRHHVAAWLCNAWAALRENGCEKSLPSHPMELLNGYYDKVAAKHYKKSRRPFRLQHYISKEIHGDVGNSLRLEVQSDPALAARNISNQHSGSSAWLQVIPTCWSLRMVPSEFRQAVRIRSGLSPTGLPPGSKCKCGDELSLPHVLSCNNLGWRTGRHDSVLSDIHSWLRARRVQVQKETHVNVRGEERVDIWVRSEAVVYWCDVVVTEPACPSIVEEAKKSSGAAVRAAEAGKLSHWASLAAEAGAKVVPLAFETSGLRGKSAQQFLKQMEGASSEGPTLASLWTQLSVTIAKMNVALVREAVRHAVGPRHLRVRGRGLGKRGRNWSSF
jgi:hypothetical protein